ncbi:MAG: DHH family phosphoesterase [Proteobacteria bacterium]|nr:DHH family phosphoesterase [Pseudomonadota bacterium]
MPVKPQVLPRSSTLIERLNRLYAHFHSDDRVLIVINADPDAIASAMALKRLLWRRVGTVTIAHSNVIKRPDNLTMIKQVKLPLTRLGDIHVKEYSRLAIVDSQPRHIELCAGWAFHVVIDHHPLVTKDAPFLDVRPEYGATSSIMTEYLRAARIKPSRNLATALFYGIKTDTNNFVRQGQIEDMRAFRLLFPQVNQNLVRKIENSGITRAALKYFREALDRVKIRKEQAVVYMGRIDNPDTLVILADFFMAVDDINTSIVAGIFKDQLVVIFRVIGLRKNAGRHAVRAFGAYGSAGGHKAMARAEVPLAKLDQKLLAKEGNLERFIYRRIREGGRTEQLKSEGHHPAS